MTTSTKTRTPAIFVDRDGTIMQDVDYCSHPQEVKIFPGVPEALRRLKSNGFKLIIITNQSGIGRGFFTIKQYRAVEAEVLQQLGDGLIDATYFCPVFIGDKEIDAECGRNAGVRTIRVQTGFQRDTADSIADWVAVDLVEAAKIILDHANE
ncbi:MAG: HAD family hydrolase [Verrucomicrobia bacterium]|nr:MAG: HAD family hydrolase [Verrucomicrobiota bacterium]